MKQAKLILANFDARLNQIKIKPKNKKTKVTLNTKMYDEKENELKKVKIVFEDVIAIEFSINYFDNMIGAEVMGLFEIEDQSFKDEIVQRNFLRRKEIYLLEGHYDYDLNEENDLLNVLDLSQNYKKNKEKYHAYIQNVDAGVYIIVSKKIKVVEK